jgi:hypothetical protein
LRREADVIALEEMGSIKALLELRDSLKANGLDLPTGNTSAASTPTFMSRF